MPSTVKGDFDQCDARDASLRATAEFRSGVKTEVVATGFELEIIKRSNSDVALEAF
jgi:hypothetical protein